MEFEADEINLAGLENLAKALGSQNPPHAKIGVLGKNALRSQGKTTNAVIMAAHEFGVPSRNLPSRSALRMPLTDHLPSKLEKTDLLGEDQAKEVLKTGSLVPWLKTVAVIAVSTCKEAFTNGGWGKWAPWSQGYENKTGEILVDTTQLRDSITEEVVE